jgi:folate-binding protein YgfZ
MKNNIKFTITKKLEFSCISITGDDASTFLQSQLCNNISELNINNLTHQLSGYCSPKGRLLFTTRVLLLSPNNYILLIPEELSSLLIKKLKMFVLRSKVYFDDVSNREHIYGVWSNSQKLLCKENESIKKEKLIFFKTLDCPILGPRFWLKSNIDDIYDLKRNLSLIIEKNVPIDSFDNKAWMVSEINTGLPWIFKETSDNYVPQTINLDLANGVSFNKGCYPGQEIVARMHFLGKNKKRVFLASITNSIDIDPFYLNNKTLIYSNDFNSNNDETTEVGQVFMLSRDYNNDGPVSKNYILLIELQLQVFKRTKNPKFAIKIADDFLNLELKSLPYEKKLSNEILNK